ncbi:MAG: hypothetical protein R2836_00895 [Chitinophagales bacterium]
MPAAYGSVSVSGWQFTLASSASIFASTSFNDTLNNQAANGCNSMTAYTVNVTNSLATTEKY